MMLNELLLHPQTLEQCTGLLISQPHALLVIGAAGSGKHTLATTLAATVLHIDPKNLRNYAYFHEINISGDGITIENIRALQQFLKLKVPQAHPKNTARVILIHNADGMRHEAQNALLKTLEEPPIDTCILLTSSQPESLLPTIRSRVTTLEILPVSQKQAEEYFKLSEGVVAKQYALARGQAGLLSALLTSTDHPLRTNVELAKNILTQPVSARLKRVEELAKDKNEIIGLLDAMLRISHAAMVAASTANKQKAVEQWHHKQAAILKALNSLKHNPNIKLLLDDLFIHI
jgi:DNA polymerase-3 subunit delta'